jgi:hypothetical protein
VEHVRSVTGKLLSIQGAAEVSNDVGIGVHIQNLWKPRNKTVVQKAVIARTQLRKIQKQSHSRGIQTILPTKASNIPINKR